MRLFALFIARPVATTLISLAITLCGAISFLFLPVAPLPQVDYPVINISASLRCFAGNHGILCRHAAGTLARADSRGVGNDLLQFPRQYQYYHGI